LTNQRDEKQVVVIGGAGYLGSVLTGQLLDQGHKVRVFDALRFGDQSLSAYRNHSAFELRRGDIRDIGQVSSCIQDANAVILLASLVGEPACDKDAKETIDINFLATKAVAEACRYYQVPRFIFASTDSAYGIQEGILYEDSPMNPISLYAQLKTQVEKEIMSLQGDGFMPTVLRMATIYGLSPRMRFDLIINILVLHSYSKGKITIFGGKQWRPLVHVSDAAMAYAMCLDAPLEAVGGQVFNVGSNDQNFQIGQLGDLLQEVLPDVDMETIPQSPDLRDYHVSFDKITETLGYQVKYSVADGIQEIYNSLKNGNFGDPTNPRYYNA